MANSWILNRLREIGEQSKEWPAWVFEQPMNRRDAEKIARGERLRSAPMANSEDVLERMVGLIMELPANPVVDDPQDAWTALAAEINKLNAEVRSLRKDRERLEWLLSMRLSESKMLCAEAEVAIAGGRDGIDSAMAAEREREA